MSLMISAEGCGFTEDVKIKPFDFYCPDCGGDPEKKVLNFWKHNCDMKVKNKAVPECYQGCFYLRSLNCEKYLKEVWSALNSKKYENIGSSMGKLFLALSVDNSLTNLQIKSVVKGFLKVIDPEGAVVFGEENSNENFAEDLVRVKIAPAVQSSVRLSLKETLKKEMEIQVKAVLRPLLSALIKSSVKVEMKAVKSVIKNEIKQTKHMLQKELKLKSDIEEP